MVPGRGHIYISGWRGAGRPRWPEGFEMASSSGTRPGEPDNRRDGLLVTRDMNSRWAPCSVRQYAERLKFALRSTNPVVGSCSTVKTGYFFLAAISKAPFPIPSVVISEMLAPT